MILLHGGRLLDPASGRDEPADIVLEGERIKETGRFDPQGPWEKVYDLEGKTAAPGFIDVHVHFRDPGFTYKEDIHSGAAAAARGGYTAVVCMANTRPVMDSPALVEDFLFRASGEKVRIHTAAALSRGLRGKELTDMEALKEAGALGFSDDGLAVMDAGLLMRALREAGRLGLPLSLHEEDKSLIGVSGVNDGRVARAMGVAGAPAASETSLVARDCALAGDAGGMLHFQHLSCAGSVDLLRRAKEAGLPVSAEVTPHHFSLTEDAVETLGTLAKVNPPLRTEADRQALIAGLRDGVIDLIATDHAPHSMEEKALPFREAPSGVTGLETAFALGVTNLVGPGFLSLGELVYRMSAAPAALYGLEGGSLREGGPADIVVFDENEVWTPGRGASKSANSPFAGVPLRGRVRRTFCRGRVVYEGG